MMHRCGCIYYYTLMAISLVLHESHAFVSSPLSRERCYNAVLQTNQSHLNNVPFQQKIVTFFTSMALATTVLFSPFNIHMDRNAYPTISISQAHAYLSENQQFITEVWSTVTSQYFDPTYNGLGLDGWKSAEQTALKAVEDTGPDDEDRVLEAIQNMLGVLGDPYTRYLPKEKYDTLTAYATGTTVAGGGGVGIQLLEDARSKNVMVMAVTENGPAAKAGLEVGDVIVKIDGQDMQGASAEIVAAKCRGDIGKQIEIDYIHTKDDGKVNRERVTLTRAAMTQQNPVKATTFTLNNGNTIGLLRIPSFSTETVSQIMNGLRSISSDVTVDAIAIDLRGNVGGYMPAGVDAAKLFLPKGSRIISEVGKSGTSSKIYDADGIGSETSIPLYVLVDKRTASASEIFAAALQDNGRAIIAGTTNSFGKGRIQSVQPLENGGVAVTRARYVTPKGRDIHGVGITPDRKPRQCEAIDFAKTCLVDII